jgi:hypothetical protein
MYTGITKQFGQAVRVGAAGAILAGLGVLGAGLIAGPTAGAIGVSPGPGPVIPGCSSTVSIGAPAASEVTVKIGTAGPGRLQDNEVVTDLKVSGCSTSTNPVVVEVLRGTSLIAYATVTPQVFTPRDDTFVGTIQLPEQYQMPQACLTDPVNLEVVASQAATRSASNAEWYSADTESSTSCAPK